MTAAYISVKHLAERWATNTMAIYRQVESEKLPALRLGQSIRIPLAAVEEYERSNTSGASLNGKRKRA